MTNIIAKNVLDYWFGKQRPIRLEESQKRTTNWFRANADLDYDIERRFGKLVSTARQGLFDRWSSDPEECLALILLLDQFPRNVHRDQASAFSSDNKALILANDLLDKGTLSELGYVEQAFALMPFQHAESLEKQNKGVEAYSQLCKKAPEEWLETIKGYYNFAKQHQAVITQFGRFPHRNEALGRQTTEAEAAYLKEAGGPFG